MKPENPLFDDEQFERFVAWQDQNEILDQGGGIIIDACRKGATQVIDGHRYDLAFKDYEYGNEAGAIPSAEGVRSSINGRGRPTLHVANVPHDTFEWRGIAGESRFAMLEPTDQHGTVKNSQFTVLRLMNVLEGHHAALPDERGLYIALPNNDGDVATFKIVRNPNHRQPVLGDSVVGGSERTQIILDQRPFIALPLTPEETLAAVAEVELAAQVYQPGVVLNG